MKGPFSPAGRTSTSGHGKQKSDAGGTVYFATGRESLTGSPLPANALPNTSAASAYTSPITDPCQKNFIVVISNGPFGDNSSPLAISQSHLAGLVGDRSPRRVCPVLGGADFTDDWGDPRPWGRAHQGIDLDGERGTPLVAIEAGTVLQASWHWSGGRQIYIRADSTGDVYYYAHLESWSEWIWTGTRVEAGDVVAETHLGAFTIDAGDADLTGGRDGVEVHQRPLAGNGMVGADPGVGVEAHDALGPARVVGVSGNGTSSSRVSVPSFVSQTNSCPTVSSPLLYTPRLVAAYSKLGVIT